MSENKILTAEDFLKSKDYNINDDGQLYDGLLTNNVINDMIEFAKLHCKAQLSAILEKADLGNFDFSEDYMEAKDSIINAYPLDLIK